MNVAGGMGCQNGDLPVFISALRPDSVVAKCGKVQVGTKYRIAGYFFAEQIFRE